MPLLYIEDIPGIETTRGLPLPGHTAQRKSAAKYCLYWPSLRHDVRSHWFYHDGTIGEPSFRHTTTLFLCKRGSCQPARVCVLAALPPTLTPLSLLSAMHRWNYWPPVRDPDKGTKERKAVPVTRNENNYDRSDTVQHWHSHNRHRMVPSYSAEAHAMAGALVFT
jgi:hypothetical protein